jgi:hypothetical protein
VTVVGVFVRFSCAASAVAKVTSDTFVATLVKFIVYIAFALFLIKE